MDKEVAIHTRFWHQQEKYVYYLVGVSVAAIGFVIVNTKGAPLNWVYLPAGLSVISWGISIYCGLRFMQYSTGTLFDNAQLLEMQKGTHPVTGTDPKKVKDGVSIKWEQILKNLPTAEKLSKAQNIFFYSGIILYLIGHIIEMYSSIDKSV